MRRKPSASHCVKNVPSLTYRPMSLVFFTGAQVVKISSSTGASPSGRFSSTSALPSILNDVPWPLTITRARLSSSPSRRKALAGTSGLRRTRMRLSTRVLAGSRSKVRSTVSIHQAGAW
ncbi:hypothetical protein D3C78_1600780 [compost metagenome]